MHDIESNIGVIGAGSVGQVFAGMLAVSGARVALIATDRSFEWLKTTGRIHLAGAITCDVPVSVAQPSSTGTVELFRSGAAPKWPFGALFATKGNGLAEAAKVLEGANLQWAMGVQNGVAKNDILAAHFGRDAVLGGVTSLAAERMPSGEVFVNSPGMTYVGELSGMPSARVEHFVRNLDAAGLPAQASNEVISVEWTKAVRAAATHAMSVIDVALDRLGSKEVSESWQRSTARGHAALAISREVAALAVAEGVEIKDFPPYNTRSDLEGNDEEILDRYRAPINTSVLLQPGRTALSGSMLRDLLANRPIEVEEIFGDLSSRAQRAGIPVPWLSYVTAVGRALNASAAA